MCSLRQCRRDPRSQDVLLAVAKAIPGVVCGLGAFPHDHLLADTLPHQRNAETARRRRRYWVWRGFWVLAPLLALVAFALGTAIVLLLRLIPMFGIGSIVASLA